ncbi:MAG: FeoB-associated Cys-rich membrane protein [candidate division Zixibacteria bacterium]|nr:FeoB-associated Cys-rich membrane protein [candidate division Zixibacteria bacterium]
MFEYSIVIAIVAAAAYFAIRKLIGEASGKTCGDCGCSCVDKNKTMKTMKTFEKSGKL